MPLLDAAKKKIRAYHLFAKTKEARDRVMGQVAGMVSRIQRGLDSVLQKLPRARSGRLASAQGRLGQLHSTMAKLLPQIRYWLRTGNVAHVGPKKWTVSDLNANENSIVVETLEMTYQYFTVA